MTVYQGREDDMFALQRMPGQMRATHIHPSTPYSTLIIHTIDHPFCIDPACSCHEKKDAIERVNLWVEQGSMTQDEATNFILGRTF